MYQDPYRTLFRALLAAWIGFALAVFFVFSIDAQGAPLEDAATWGAANQSQYRLGQPSLLMAKGEGDDTVYVLEVDPVTGKLPVEASFVSGDDHNYGTVGADTLRTAAQIGNASGAAAFGTGARSAQTLRVTVATDDSVPVTDGGGALTVDGTVAATQSGTWNINNVSGTMSLPTGASTAAHQVTQNANLAAIETAVEGTLVVGDGGSSLTVDGTVAASNLPTTVDTNSGAAGASTLRSVLATRHEAAATPISVRLSNGSAFGNPADAGRSYVTSVRNAYASTSVTTGAWVELVSSLGSAVNGLTVFDSCGQTLELGTGAAAAETRVALIPPGGLDGVFPLAIAASTRVSIRAVSGNCTVGEIDINFLN